MLKLTADVEADGLLPTATKIHCIVAKNRETGEFHEFATGGGYPSIEEGLAFLASADVLYFHNGIRYDFPLIRKLHPHVKLRGRLMDSMVLAQARFIHIKETDYKRAKAGKFPGGMCGRHSLEAWGHRLGIHKGNYEGTWEEWNQDMHDYCRNDVVVADALIDLVAKAGLPAETVELETDLATYLDLQQNNGWPFDVDAARDLESTLRARLETIDMELRETFGAWYEDDGVRIPKASRTMRKGKPAPESYEEGCAYHKIKLVEFNPNSRPQIEKVLRERYGWKPEEFTPSGQAKIDESTLVGLDYPEAKKLIEFLTVAKRLGQLADGKVAWLKEVSDKPHPLTGLHHIHHSCRPGPITHRMKHSNPNLGQVPAVYSDYGPECRSLFTVPAGWKMVGADVAGLELRIMAHHMYPVDDGVYAQQLLDPDYDSHSVNAEALGISRDGAKTWFYAYIYGAGNWKLGRIALPEEGDDNKLRARGKRDRGKFERAVPVLGTVVDQTKRAFRHRGGKGKGYLRLLDGRRAYPRGEHSAFNTLVQGDGAIVCKRWVVDFSRAMTERYGPQGWDGQWAALGFIHDEIQIACREEIAEDVAKLAVAVIAPVGERFGLRVPLTGDAKIGSNWKETH